MTRQTTSLRDDRSIEGLPTADDYEPEALGTIETRTGDPEQTWDEYGLELVPIEYRSRTQDDWTDTGRRLVNRNGKFIADVSDDYKLLPNERLVGVANDVAQDMGAIPFHEFDGDWFMTLDDHVYQDPERRRVHAVYAWEKGEIGGDAMEYGFGVHNSIDGSLGFSVGLFSFRHACANMVFMGTNTSLGAFAEGVESERRVLASDSHRHTHGLEVDHEALASRIKSTLVLVDAVDDTYRSWLSRQVTPEDVAAILSRHELATKDLPGWMRDLPDILAEVAADEGDAEDEEEAEAGDLPWERQAEVIEANMPAAVATWDTYNSLTEAAWHRGNSNDQTRRRKMKGIHAVFDPVGASDSFDNIQVR